MASNTTYRAALTKRPQHIVAILGVVWLSTFAAFAGYEGDERSVSANHDQLSYYPILEQAPSSRPLKERFAVSLSEKDKERYIAIWAEQAQENWNAADELIQTLDDTILVGGVLADRYLSEGYTTSYNELAKWMASYADHPKAVRIHRLALRKKPDASAAPNAPQHKGRLKGYGTVSGIGNAERPALWSRAMAEYKAGDYTKAESLFAKSAKQAKNKWYASASHFWAGRSAQLAKNDADTHYQNAAKHSHTLYGSLARYALGNALLEEAYNANSDHGIYDRPALARASAYKELAMDESAEEELRHLFVVANREGREQLMHVAAALELPALQLRISQSLWYNTKRHHAGDYPVPQWELAEHSAKTPRELLFAIARQESGFNPEAQSRVGATGVMQLMPQTARYIIKKNRLNEVQVASTNVSFPKSPFTLSNLNQPEINLAIGAHYVDYLAEKDYIDNNLIYTLTAYNAGPGKLRKWKRNFEGMKDPLLFIESLPYRETRHYVSQVLTNHIMYSLLNSGEAHVPEALLLGEWPNVYE